MKEIFLSYAKMGAMTKEQVADVLQIRPDAVARMARSGKIPRIPGLRLLRFDAIALMGVFCAVQGTADSRSLTIEKHKTRAKPNGGFRKCL